MKLISPIQIIITVLAFGFQQIKAQELHPILASFSLSRSAESITANFGILGGASCFGVDLERSIDSTNYEVVAIIPGICGGTEQTEFYTITDESPVENQLNLYRLNLGTEGKSATIGIFYLTLDAGMSIFPIPADENIRVLLNNPLLQNFELSILTSDGKIIQSISNISSDDLLVNVAGFAPGNYILKISYANGTELAQKFMVY